MDTIPTTEPSRRTGSLVVTYQPASPLGLRISSSRSCIDAPVVSTWASWASYCWALDGTKMSDARRPMTSRLDVLPERFRKPSFT